MSPLLQDALQKDGRLRTLLRDARRLRRERPDASVQELMVGMEQRMRQLVGVGAATPALRNDDYLQAVKDRLLEVFWR